MSSKLGWLLAERTNEFTDQCDDVNFLIMSPGRLTLTTNTYMYDTLDPVLNGPQLQDFRNVEKIGIIDDDITNDGANAYDQFRKTLTFQEGRSHVQWPWKEQCPNAGKP